MKVKIMTEKKNCIRVTISIDSVNENGREINLKEFKELKNTLDEGVASLAKGYNDTLEFINKKLRGWTNLKAIQESKNGAYI